MTVTRLGMLGTSVAALALASWGCSSPEAAGAADAERDIAAGVLRLKTYGLPSPWFFEYAELMEARLGVEIQGVAGCDVDDGLRRRVAGYNRRVEREIRERFGPAAQETIEAEAKEKSGRVGW
jgi:hypothetical protein